MSLDMPTWGKQSRLRAGSPAGFGRQLWQSPESRQERQLRSWAAGPAPARQHRSLLQLIAQGSAAIIIAFLAAPCSLGQVKPADIAGDWVLQINRYGETEYQRLKLDVEGDRVKTTTGPLKFEGHVTNGKLEMKTAGKDGPSGT